MRLIDADGFIEYLGLDAENAKENNLGNIVTLEDFERQITVDSEQVRHGKWQHVDYPPWYVCSECRNEVMGLCHEELGTLTEYCPNCGAKMKNAGLVD